LVITIMDFTTSSTSGGSAVGSEIFALLALLVISIVVLLILRHYLPLRSTPGYLLVPVFLALSLPASIVLLVPIDLASHAKADGGTEDVVGGRGIWLPDRVLLVSWRISYWLTFALTWYVRLFLLKRAGGNGGAYEKSLEGDGCEAVTFGLVEFCF
jgi:hypothetical protein